MDTVEPTTRTLIICYDAEPCILRKCYTLIDREKGTTAEEVCKFCLANNVVAIYAMGHSLTKKHHSKEGVMTFGATIFTLTNITKDYEGLMKRPDGGLKCVVCVSHKEYVTLFFDRIEDARIKYEELFKKYGPGEVAMV